MLFFFKGLNECCGNCELVPDKCERAISTWNSIFLALLGHNVSLKQNISSQIDDLIIVDKVNNVCNAFSARICEEVDEIKTFAAQMTNTECFVYHAS